MSLYEEVTSRIIAELENGTVPWVKPWKTMMPYNAVSQKEYSGVNVLLLWNTAFTQSAWLTYRQAQDLGGHVKQGEKATSIVYASKYIKKAVDESGEETEEKYRFLNGTRSSTSISMTGCLQDCITDQHRSRVKPTNR